MAKLTLYANPYDISETGFYFHDEDEWEEKFDEHPAKEFSIEFIDGDEDEQKLFDLMEPGQGDVEDYFDAVNEGWDSDDLTRIQILVEDVGYSFDDAVNKKDDLIVYGEFDSDEDFAEEYVDSMGGPSELGQEILERYFDYQSFGRDLVLGGDVSKDGRLYYDARDV